MLGLFAQVAMGEHDTLGNTCGTSGILVHGHSIKIQRHLLRVGRIACDQCFPFVKVVGRFDVGSQTFFLAHQREKEIFGKGEIVTDTGIDNLFDLGFWPKIDHPVAEQIQGDQHFGSGIIELMLQLPVGIQRVVHHGYSADAQDGIVGGHTRDYIGQQDRHTVSLFYPEVGQASGKSIRHFVQFAKADLITLKCQGHFIRERLGRPLQELRQADVFILNMFGNACLVVVQPRFFQIGIVCAHLNLLFPCF